jgi:hypothetical protein
MLFVFNELKENMSKQLNELKTVSLNSFSHLNTYLSQLTSQEYATPLSLLSNTSIGSHTRHILDGYLCLVNQQSTKTINYDKRNREQTIETDIEVAMSKIKEIQKALIQIQPTDFCYFETNYCENNFQTKTSIEREMIHNIEHTIHHLAIIKIALQHYFPHIILPKEFGVAFSTLQYWETSGATKS